MLIVNINTIISMPYRNKPHRHVMNVSQRIRTYLHIYKCTKSGTRAVVFGSDWDPVGISTLTVLSESMLSYLNEQ